MGSNARTVLLRGHSEYTLLRTFKDRYYHTETNRPVKAVKVVLKNREDDCLLSWDGEGVFEFVANR